MLDEWAALEGRVAVVTGGAGGLGRPITVELARAGVAVATCDRDARAVDEIEKVLEGTGTPFVTACFDVRDSAALAAFFELVDERFGRVDILVNVPGGGFRAPVLDLTANGVTAVIRQNFVYALEACQLAARRMQAQGSGGSIVNVSTIEAHRAMPDMGVYGAMKAAVEHLTKTLAVELGPSGIRVNAVAPDIFPNQSTAALGFTSSDTTSPLAQMEYDIAIPLGRPGRPSDLSGCVLFLASELAAYVTGTTLHVDGGTLANGGWMRWPEGYDNTVPRSVLALLRDDQGGVTPPGTGSGAPGPSQ